MPVQVCFDIMLLDLATSHILFNIFLVQYNLWLNKVLFSYNMHFDLNVKRSPKDLRMKSPSFVGGVRVQD